MEAVLKVSAALQGVSLLLLDTAPVIYLIEQNPAYLDLVKSVFERVDDGRLNAVTTPVTLAECLIYPIKFGLPKLRRDFIDFIVNGTNTSFIGLDQTIGEEAAKHRANYNLSLPDALQVAAAIHSGCDAFLTNDSQLKRVTEVKILVLDELEAD